MNRPARPVLIPFLIVCAAALAGCGSDPDPTPVPGAAGIPSPEDETVEVRVELPSEVVQGEWADARVTVKNLSACPILLWSAALKDVRGGTHSWLQHPPAML